MADGALPLAIGTALALLALVLVLAPLLSSVQAARSVQSPDAPARPAGVPEERESAVAALREIEFDRATGKLSDADYADLKQRYTRAALEEMRASDGGAVSPSAHEALVTDADSIEDVVEAAIARARLAHRSCPDCGPRPEGDATYCSNCGRYLPGACHRCGAVIDTAASRFCTACGEQLAA